jgi:hypothetical protein
MATVTLKGTFNQISQKKKKKWAYRAGKHNITTAISCIA